MRLVFDRQVDLAAFIAERLYVLPEPPYTIIGVEDRKGILRAAFLFNDWNGSNIEMTVVSDHLLTKGVFRALANYAWTQLKAQRCTIRTSVQNKLVVKMAQRIGWSIEGYQPRYYPDGSTAVIMGMLKEECRW